MKLKLDENLGHWIAGIFREQGHDVATVASEGLSGNPDAEVFRAAQDEGRTLVTLDRGFGYLARFAGTSAGVVVLLPRGSAAREMLGRLAREAATSLVSADLRAKLWIVEADRIRERGGDADS